MALAILEYEDGSNRVSRFRLDIGCNRFYRYATGDDEVVTRHGVELLANPKYVSEIMGPLSERSLGRSFLDIPRRFVDAENRFIQLTSYRERDGTGPAISGICEIPRSYGSEIGGLPSISFSKETANVNGTITTPLRKRVDTIPCDVTEKRPMSQAMFLGAIAGMLPSILPAITSALPSIMPMVGNLLGGLMGGGAKPAAAPAVSAVPTPVAPGPASATPAPAAGGAAVVPGGIGKLIEAIANPETINAVSNLVDKFTKSKSMSAVRARRGVGYATVARTRAFSSDGAPISHAMVAPALLAALPALMPLLQKMLDPSVLSSLRENLGPEKTISAVTDSLLDMGKLSMEGQKQVQDHLERLAMAPDPVDAIVANLSVASGIEQQYRRVESVTLNFIKPPTQMLHGRNRVAYRFGQDLGFPLSVVTPRSFGNAVLQVIIKDSETLEVLDHKKWRVPEVRNGAMANVPRFSWARLSQLKPGHDYLVSVSLTWKNGEVGTSRKLLITLVPDYSFDHVKQAGEPIPLDDPVAYREFWHRVWAGTFDSENKGIAINATYYYELGTDRSENARRETLLTRPKPKGGTRSTAKLKTGMKLGMDSLTELISRVSAYSPPNGQQLAALDTPDFKNRFSQKGQAEVKLRGRDGDNVAFWVYPVVKLQAVILKKVVETNKHGQVTAMTEEQIHFPMPVMAQFVGLKSE